jgi:hypothetical protein
MRRYHLAFAALAALLLAGCAAPTSSPDAPKAPAAEQAVSQPTAPTPTAAPTTPTPNAQAPAARPPDTMERKPIADASNPGRSCKTDSDCAVKDVGNCCGAYPMCVSKNAKTDPAAVRAQCAKAGIAAVCGFQEVSGCQCVKGQCENLGNGSVVM